MAARWTGYFTPKTTGEYTIYAGGHDGFRVSLDDKNIMTQWDWESTSTEGETFTLEAGSRTSWRWNISGRKANSRLGLAWCSRRMQRWKKPKTWRRRRMR